MPGGLGRFFGEIKGYPLVVLSVCLFAWTLANMDQSLFGYAIQGIRAEFDASLEAISWILFASFVFAALAAVVIGLAADRFGRRIVLAVCLGISALLVGMQAIAPTLLILAALRAVAFGMSNSLAQITTTYTVEASPSRYRGVMTGFLQCGYPLGWFIAAMYAAPLMRDYGWRSIFLVALVVVPLSVVIYRFLPESKRFEASRAERSGADQQAQQSWGAKLRELYGPELRRRTLLIQLAFLMFGGAYSGTAFFFPTFYNEFRGYIVEDATTIVGLAYGIGMIGYIGSAVVGEFFLTRRNTTAIWVWIGALALLGVVWLPTTFAQDVFWFSMMAAFFYGSNGVLATLLTEVFPTHVRATGTAVAGGFAINIGFATYPVLVAQAIEKLGWQWAFTLAVFPSLVIGGLAIISLDNYRSGIDVDEIVA